MSNIVIVGAQWGDEGKGKVVDHLAAGARWVVRFQGGNNAGHTLVVDGKKTVLHCVPSGVLHPGVTSVIGNGCVVDPWVLTDELESLRKAGHPVGPDRLQLSSGAHLIMPYHVALDRAREESAGDKKIGTTGRGIGPCYEDKVGRRGVQFMDLFHHDRLRERIRSALVDTNWRLARFGNTPLSHGPIVDSVIAVADGLTGYIGNTPLLLNAAVRKGETILFEGAQGFLLDVDHGDYPFVTSSNTVAGNACAGSGVGPTVIDDVLGVAKAYCTRVGSGPFPTEQKNALGDRLRDVGQEYGATTGRPRRCGWLDLVLLKQAVMVEGITRWAVTKLDVLTGLPEIHVCVEHKDVEPRYEAMPGWTKDISSCRAMEELPTSARRYIEMIERSARVPVTLVGVGPDREQTIVVDY